MEHVPDGSDDPVVQTLEFELGLVRSAIALVASGGAPRVILGSLRFGEQLVEPARRMALESGVRIVPMWTTGESGADLTAERAE